MARGNETESESLGLVWIDHPHSVAALGLARILEREARVHVGWEAPTGEIPSLIILGTNGAQYISENVKRLRRENPDAPVLVFGPHLDLPLARTALRQGAHGFIHAEMQPEQIIHALKAAMKGEIVAPRKLLEYLIFNEGAAGFDALSARQREILKLVGEGLTNAQIAKRLFLVESTVKQHLRAAYKLLGVSNRTEAAKLMRDAG